RSGRFVAFESDATNLAPGGTNGVLQVYVHDRMTGQTVRASVDPVGVSGDADSHTFNGAPHLSDDGRFVAFDGYSDNLVAGDTNATGDVFVRDLMDPCRAGNVNTGVGAAADVLTVRGSAGDPVYRIVEVGAGSPVTIAIAKPPAGGNGQYAL